MSEIVGILLMLYIVGCSALWTKFRAWSLAWPIVAFVVTIDAVERELGSDTKSQKEERDGKV